MVKERRVVAKVDRPEQQGSEANGEHPAGGIVNGRRSTGKRVRKQSRCHSHGRDSNNLQCIMHRRIGADGRKQRVGKRAGRANRSCFALAWKGDTDELTDSDEQTESQGDWRLNQTP
jgi:hypothetical protein